MKGQHTWVTHIMDAGGKDHGCNFQIGQLLRKLVIGQEATQRLSHICRMNVVVVRIAVICPLYVLHWILCSQNLGSMAL